MAFKRYRASETGKPYRESADRERPKKTQQCRLCKGSKRLHITDGVVIPLVDALELANRKSTERPAWADLPDRFLRESIECGDCNGTGSV